MIQPRPLPKAGDRINRDPSRDEGDTPDRWRDIGRKSAKVVAVVDDDGVKVIVYRWHSKRRGWQYVAEDEHWWHLSTSWEIGPLPQPPRSR